MIMNWKGCGSNHGLNRDHISTPAWRDWGKLIQVARNVKFRMWSYMISASVVLLCSL
jgi:hypothetical protein